MLSIYKILRGLLVIGLVCCLAYGAWWLGNRPVNEAAEWDGAIKSFSFAPFQADQNPLNGRHPSPDDIAKDLKFIADYGHGVRTYSSLNNQEKIPELARPYKLKVYQGAWLDKNIENNRAELDSLIQLMRTNRNVTMGFAGNEVLLRGDLTVDELIAHIKEVKHKTGKPVTTAEVWQTWHKYPELAEAVDIIAVHVLPYWEGVPIDKAVGHVFFRYDELKAKYPNKKIMLAEVGWPSQGPWLMGSEPSLVNQAHFIREFLNEAKKRKVDYTIMEAYDQPWKYALEGPVGTAWGIFNAERILKFPMAGAVQENESWRDLYMWSVVLAFPLMVFFLYRRRKDMKFTGQLVYCTMVMGFASLLVATISAVATQALLISIGIAWSLLVLAQIIMVTVTLFDGFEMTEMLWKSTWKRRFAPQFDEPLPAQPPKVSIHIPCYNEPPEMVIETIQALTVLDYPNFEVLVVDNNTKDEAVWGPLRDYVNGLNDARFRFIHLPSWPGFKAGALNYAQTQMAPDTDIIAVIDSDYVVQANWLRGMIPFFNDTKVGLVQSPQAYRDWQDDAFKRMCNWEYAGFFHIGMIQRNERNAIIQHGTMTIIRRTAMEQVGGWAEWCITEDAELGLKLFENGWEAIYCEQPLGRGLVPDSFAAYKGQRHRWAYGAVQIIKHHWRELLPGAKRLSRGQRFHFLTGWLPWFADAAHTLFAYASIFWSVGFLIIPKIFGFPPTMFMIPTIAAFTTKLVFSFWLYSKCVKCGLRDRIGAAFAGMALTHTVGRAILQGLFTHNRPFVRTPKCENKPAITQAFLMARSETIMLVALWSLAIIVPTAASWANREAVLWSVLLMVQSLPFFAAFVTALVNVWPQHQSQKIQASHDLLSLPKPSSDA